MMICPECGRDPYCGWGERCIFCGAFVNDN